MKKLFGSLVIVIGLVGYSQAQFFDYVSINIPSASLQTNLIDGPCVVYEIQFDPLLCASVTTNLNFALCDSPKTNTPRSGTATANILEYTNSGYTYYSGAFSNMNYLAAGSMVVTGMNYFVNYAGVITTITNSSVLSNYYTTRSNFQAGAVALRPTKITGLAVTNTTTTFTFADGFRFGMGITMTNRAGVAAIQDGYIVRIKYQPVR